MLVLNLQYFLFNVNCKDKSGMDLAKYNLLKGKYEQELSHFPFPSHPMTLAGRSKKKKKGKPLFSSSI